MKVIKDEFTDLPVDRRRRWQLRKRAEGKCITCGEEAYEKTQYCISHRKYHHKKVDEFRIRYYEWYIEYMRQWHIKEKLGEV